MNAQEYAAQVRADLNETWLPNIYRRRVRSKATRAYQFEGLGNNARVAIQHTLLGVELKAGRRRLLCRFSTTASYVLISSPVAVAFSICTWLHCRAIGVYHR